MSCGGGAPNPYLQAAAAEPPAPTNGVDVASSVATAEPQLPMCGSGPSQRSSVERNAWSSSIVHARGAKGCMRVVHTCGARKFMSVVQLGPGLRQPAGRPRFAGRSGFFLRRASPTNGGLVGERQLMVGRRMVGRRRMLAHVGERPVRPT